MKFLQDGIQWIFDGLLSGFSFLFGIVESFYKAYTAVTIIFLGVLWFGLMYATDCLIWLGQKIPQLLVAVQTGSVSGMQVPGPLATGFDIANHFVPLTEFFGSALFLISTWMIAVTIRAIKAWIPTLT